jgi:hypothetical protein
MNPPDPDLIVIFSFASFAVLAVSIARLVGKWIDRRGQLAQGDRSDERLSRIEQAVDAIAIEVERISEAQRFTTKLLAEKNGAKVPDVTPTR